MTIDDGIYADTKHQILYNPKTHQIVSYTGNKEKVCLDYTGKNLIALPNFEVFRNMLDDSAIYVQEKYEADKKESQ